jgi:hypothetical protein
LPLYVLDLMQFRSGGAKVPQHEFLQAHADLLRRDEWIIDGFDNVALAWERFAAADTLIYVDLPLWIHYSWVTKRFIKGVARQFEPLERLAKVRTMFFPQGRSLGQRTMPVISQSADPQYGKFRENLGWSLGGVTFVTLHIVGSNDNFGRTPEMDSEHRERKAANIAWLRKAFSEAKAHNSRGLALLTQANPGFENYWPTGQKDTYLRLIPGARTPEKAETTGYDEYVAVLVDEWRAMIVRPLFFTAIRIGFAWISRFLARRAIGASRTSCALRPSAARILTG